MVALVTTAISGIGGDGGVSAVAVVTTASIGLLAGAAELWHRLSGPDQPGRTPRELAENLADVVRTEWRAEATSRKLDSSGILRLSWSQAASDVSGDTVRPPSAPAGLRTRLRLDGRLDEGFDTAAAGLAERFAQNSGKRLVVLGEPGSGKTVLAMMLVLGLLQRAAGNGSRTPVLLSASSWDPLSERFDLWVIRMVAELYYGGQQNIPRLLLEQDLILPVLDGLDEIPESSRRDAIRGINEVLGKDRPVVLTCRLAEYADVIKNGSPALQAAPVVQVRPIPVEEVITYLSGLQWPPATEWSPVFDRIRDRPESPLAGALSTPLMVSIARTTYHRSGGDPSELLRLESRHDVEDFLLDRLVDAAYTRDPADPPSSPDRGTTPAAADARRWLTLLAQHMHRAHVRDLAWWEVAPRLLSPWVGAGVGLVGGVLAMIVTSVVGTVFGSGDSDLEGGDPGRWLYIGALVGAVFLACTAIVWYALQAPRPGRLLLPRRGAPGRLRERFAIGVVLVGGPAVVILLASAVAITLTGWTFAAVSGYEAMIAVGVALAVVVGAALAVHAVLNAQGDQARRVDPVSLLRKDRASALVEAGVTGTILIIGWLPIIAAGELGDALGAAFTGWPGLPEQDWVGSYRDSLRALSDDVFVVVLSGALFGSLLLVTRAWPRFVVVRLIYAVRGRLPWRLMRFLADARNRQLLRQVGGTYQFRHARLQERLVSRAALDRLPTPEGKPRPMVRRVRLIAVICVTLLILVFVPWLDLPRDLAQRTLTTPTTAIELAYDPTGSRLAIIDSTGEILLQRVAGGKPTKVRGPLSDETGRPRVPDRLQFSPDGNFLIVVEDGTISVWDIRPEGPELRWSPLTISPDGGTLVSQSAPRTDDLGLYKVTGEFIRTLCCGGGGEGSVAYSSDGTKVVVSEISGRKFSIYSTTDSGVKPTSFTITSQFRHFVLTRADRILLFDPTGQPPGVQLVDAATGEQVDTVIEGRYLGHSDDGTRIITSKGRWDGRTGALVEHISAEPSDLYPNDDGTLVTWDHGAECHLWNASKGVEIATSDVPGNDCGTVRFSPDGSLVAAAVQSGDGEDVVLCDGSTGRLVTRLTGHTDYVTAIAFRPDGGELATASGDGTIRIWDVPQ